MRAGYHPGSGDDKKDSLKKQGFYHTPAWRRIRRMALQRDHYLCQLRISPRCTKTATEVHHVRPLEDFPELGLELGNLVSCCWFCHEETKHRRVEPAVSGVRGVRVVRVRDGSEAEGWKYMD